MPPEQFPRASTMVRRRSPIIFLVACVLFLLPGGMALKGQEKSSQASVQTAGLRDGVIGPNDALNIFVRAAEEMTKTWRVGPDGQLNLPLVGTVEAAGKTVDQFERMLTTKLKEFLLNPQVTVSIADTRSAPVTILGAVGTPGTLQLEGRKTLLDILMAVGGPKDAGPTLTLSRRAAQGPIPLPEAHEDDGGKYSVATLNLKDILSGRTPAANLIMQPQDVISVSVLPPPLPRLVQIIGEVAKPGAIELVHKESVSIMQALAAAGGPTHTAAAGRTVIMHVNVDGRRTEIAQIDLRKILEGKVKDIELVAGDIVVVPTSQVKSYLDIVARTMVSSSTMVLTRF